MDLLTASCSEIVSAIRSQKITAEHVTSFFLGRAKNLNPSINAFISFNEKAISQAREIDARVSNSEQVGALAGLPVGVKDLLCTKDQPTTASSKMLEGFESSYDATVVKRLLDADAIVIGKTSLDEFAMGSSNETSYFGTVKNPWNTLKVPGGSSGGSAAAVAARMCPAAIGTDTGGSIRQPASFCGVAGIKPTYGLVSRFGIIAFASSLDQAGPMASYASDCQLILKIISGKDTKDETSSEFDSDMFLQSLDVTKLKVGIPKEYLGEGLSEEIKSSFSKSIEKIEALGASVREISLPHTKFAVPTYYIIASSEASSNLARYDGVRFGHRSKKAKSLEQVYSMSRSEGFGPEVKRRILLGTFALSSGYKDEYYDKACKIRSLIHGDFTNAFSDTCDLILSPVTTETAFPIGQKIDDPISMYNNDVFTISANLAGIPAMSVNAGFSKSGLPIGIQIMGPRFKDAQVMELAKQLELSLASDERRPNVF